MNLPIVFASIITSTVVALSLMLNTVRIGMDDFNRTSKQLRDSQVSILAGSSTVASISNDFLLEVSNSLKQSIASAVHTCVSSETFEKEDGSLGSRCQRYEWVVNESLNSTRLNIVDSYQNSLMNFNQDNHKVKSTVQKGLNGGFEKAPDKSIHRGLELNLLASTDPAIQGNNPGFVNFSRFRFTSDRLASQLLSESNPAMKKIIYPNEFSSKFKSGDDLRISERLLKNLLTTSEYKFITENQLLGKMDLQVFNANDSLNHGLDYTELANGLKAQMKISTGTKEIEDPNNPHHKIPEENIEDLSLYGAAQLRTLNTTIASIGDDDTSDERCLNGELPVNGVCPSDTVCEGTLEECEPCPINTYRHSDGSCTTCHEQGTCIDCITLGTCPTCQQQGTCCADGRDIPPSGECDPEPEEAYDFNLESFNPNLFDLVYDPNEPISADNPACVVQNTKKPKNASYTCYYIDENGELITEQGKGFEFTEGQEVADPGTSVNIGRVGDPNADASDVNIEGRPRAFQRTGKLTTGFDLNGREIPSGAVVVKVKKPNGKVEFQFFDPVTGELLAVANKDDIPKSVRKDANDSIKDFEEAGGAGINDLFQGDAADAAEAFINSEDNRGNLTDANIATKNKKWHRKNRNHRGVKLGNGTVTVNGVEHEVDYSSDNPLAQLAIDLETSTAEFAQLKDKQSDDKGAKKEAKDEYDKAKKDVNKINNKIDNLEDKLKGASKKKKKEIRAKIADLEGVKTEVKIERKKKENTFTSAKTTYQNTKAQKKAAKVEIKQNKKAIKNHFKPAKKKAGKKKGKK